MQSPISLAASDGELSVQSCCGDEPPEYQPIKSSDFMTEKFNAAHKT